MEKDGKKEGKKEDREADRQTERETETETDRGRKEGSHGRGKAEKRTQCCISILSIRYKKDH